MELEGNPSSGDRQTTVWAWVWAPIALPPPLPSALMVCINTKATSLFPVTAAVAEARRKAMCRMGFFMECFMNKYWNEQFALLKNWCVPQLFQTHSPWGLVKFSLVPAPKVCMCAIFA